MSADRVSEFISKVREDYQGVPNGSPQVEALMDIEALIGSSVRRDRGFCEINNWTIFRKKHTDLVYRNASERLSELAVACLENDEGATLRERATSVDDGLRNVISELYPTRSS